MATCHHPSLWPLLNPAAVSVPLAALTAQSLVLPSAKIAPKARKGRTAPPKFTLPSVLLPPSDAPPGLHTPGTAINLAEWLVHFKQTSFLISHFRISPLPARTGPELKSLISRCANLARLGLRALFVADRARPPPFVGFGPRGKRLERREWDDELESACAIVRAFGFPVLEVGAPPPRGPDGTEQDASSVASQGGPRSELSLGDLILPHLGLPLAITDSPFPLLLGIPCVGRNASPRTVSSSGSDTGEGTSTSLSSSSFFSSNQTRLTLHSIDHIQETLLLDRPGLILYHHLTAGTDALAPLGGAGPATALGLARTGFGGRLAEILNDAKRRADNPTGDGSEGAGGVNRAALDAWRSDLADELTSNSMGHLPRRAPALASSLPSYFPNLPSFARFLHPPFPPGVSLSAVEGARASLDPDVWWDRDPDTVPHVRELMDRCGRWGGWSRVRVQVELERAGAWEGREAFRARSAAHRAASVPFRPANQTQDSATTSEHNCESGTWGAWEIARRRSRGGADGFVVRVLSPQVVDGAFSSTDFLRPPKKDISTASEDGGNADDEDDGAVFRMDGAVVRAAMPIAWHKFEGTKPSELDYGEDGHGDESSKKKRAGRKKKVEELDVDGATIVSEKKTAGRKQKKTENDMDDAPIASEKKRAGGRKKKVEELDVDDAPAVSEKKRASRKKKFEELDEAHAPLAPEGKRAGKQKKVEELAMDELPNPPEKKLVRGKKKVKELFMDDAPDVPTIPEKKRAARKKKAEEVEVNNAAIASEKKGAGREKLEEVDEKVQELAVEVPPVPSPTKRKRTRKNAGELAEPPQISGSQGMTVDVTESAHNVSSERNRESEVGTVIDAARGDTVRPRRSRKANVDLDVPSPAEPQSTRTRRSRSEMEHLEEVGLEQVLGAELPGSAQVDTESDLIPRRKTSKSRRVRSATVADDASLLSEKQLAQAEHEELGPIVESARGLELTATEGDIVPRSARKRSTRAASLASSGEDLSGAESAESGHPPEPGPIMVEERMRKRRPPSKSGRGNGEEDQTATILEPKMEGTSSASSKRRSRAKTIDVVEDLSGAESAESGHPPEPGPIMVEERMRKRRPPSKSGRGNGEEDQTATILEPKMEGTSSASSKRRSRAKTIDVVEESTIKPVQQAQKDSMWEGATGDEHSAISLAPVVAKRTRAKFRTKGSGSR